MVKIAAEPYGAADIVPKGLAFVESVPSGGTTGCEGRNGTKCFLL